MQSCRSEGDMSKICKRSERSRQRQYPLHSIWTDSENILEQRTCKRSFRKVYFLLLDWLCLNVLGPHVVRSRQAVVGTVRVQGTVLKTDTSSIRPRSVLYILKCSKIRRPRDGMENELLRVCCRRAFVKDTTRAGKGKTGKVQLNYHHHQRWIYTTGWAAPRCSSWLFSG